MAGWQEGGRRVAGVLALFVGSERFAVTWLYRPGQSFISAIKRRGQPLGLTPNILLIFS